MEEIAVKKTVKVKNCGERVTDEAFEVLGSNPESVTQQLCDLGKMTGSPRAAVSPSASSVKRRSDPTGEHAHLPKAWSAAGI